MSTDRSHKITDEKFQEMMQRMDKEDPTGDKAMARLRKAALKDKKVKPEMKAAATEHFIVIGPVSLPEAELLNRDILLQLLAADSEAPKMQVKISNRLCAKSAAVKIGVDWCEAGGYKVGPDKYWILELSLAGQHKYRTLIGRKESPDCGIHIPASFLSVLGRYVISGHNMSMDEPQEVIYKADIQRARKAVEEAVRQREIQTKDSGIRSPSPISPRAY